jgi:hypothetical protein
MKGETGMEQMKHAGGRPPGRARLRSNDVTRLLRDAEKAGVEVDSIVVLPDGTLKLIPVRRQAAAAVPAE